MDFNEENRSVTEGALTKATVGTDTARRDFSLAETEVVASARKRKRYTESYKKKVVEHLSELRRTGTGDIGGYLRREGIYYTMVNKWEKKFQMSENKKTKTAGSKASRERELEEKVKNLEKELERTKKKLQKSELIIDFQKKISLLLNPDQEDQQEQK